MGKEKDENLTLMYCHKKASSNVSIERKRLHFERNFSIFGSMNASNHLSTLRIGKVFEAVRKRNQRDGGGAKWMVERKEIGGISKIYIN